MSPKSSKFHKKLLKTEYRKILRLFVADITEFPEKIYLEKLQTNFQDGSNLQTRICRQKYRPYCILGSRGSNHLKLSQVTPLDKTS